MSSRQPVFTLSCPDHCRTNGDLVAGTVNLHIERAKRKQVVAVKVELTCDDSEIQNRQPTLPEFLDEEKIIWKQYDTEKEIEDQISVGSGAMIRDEEEIPDHPRHRNM
ncbi:hypothetical protein Clacol_008509 [Clathrus columnatus]|uniref:Uncharacterized protein n=1 Tax=Clathrus columnatus TaxID=1419009 RepID=A0AAV5AQU8_9AGAM|nr:hypothetical protein Clacol_008509 [Clathrus columnatus]